MKYCHSNINGNEFRSILVAKFAGEWALFFECAALRSVVSGRALIQHGDPERTLCFVLRSSLEVIHSGNGMSLVALSKATVGAALGEITFFDGRLRSATVWAIEDSLVAAMTLERFTAFESRHPRLGRDLLFALVGCLQRECAGLSRD